MRNKFVKGLVALGLCAVSMVGLVGCSLDESQQKALDTAVNKSTELVHTMDETKKQIKNIYGELDDIGETLEGIESAISSQGNKLTKAEAANKIQNAALMFDLYKYQEIYMHGSQTKYEDKTFTSVSEHIDAEFYFKHNQNEKLMYIVTQYLDQSSQQTVFHKTANDSLFLDVQTDASGVRVIDNSFAADEYYSYSRYDYTVNSLGLHKVSEDNIIDIRQNGDNIEVVCQIGYIFDEPQFNSLTVGKSYYVITLKDNDVVSVNVRERHYNFSDRYYFKQDGDGNIILDKYGIPVLDVNYSNVYDDAEYKSYYDYDFELSYSGIDFTPATSAISTYKSMLPTNDGMYYLMYDADNVSSIYYKDGKFYSLNNLLPTVEETYIAYKNQLDTAAAELEVLSISISNGNMVYRLSNLGGKTATLIFTSPSTITVVTSQAEVGYMNLYVSPAQ